MECIGLHAAKYNSEVLVGDLFKGRCSIVVDSLYGTNSTSSTNIHGEPKDCPFVAETSAAGQAIRYLERAKNFDVVDFNYDKMILVREKCDNLMHFCLQYDAVVAEAYKSWTCFISKVRSFISQQYGMLNSGSLPPNASANFGDLVALIRDLELALHRTTTKQHNAFSGVFKSEG